MPSTNAIPATDSANELRPFLGDDATATFESDANFIDSNPAENGSSENVEEQRASGIGYSAATRKGLDDYDSDEKDEDDDEEEDDLDDDDEDDDEDDLDEDDEEDYEDDDDEYEDDDDDSDDDDEDDEDEDDE